MTDRIFAGIELDGTKTICTLGSSPDQIAAQIVLPTTDGPATLAAIVTILAGWQYDALGIASFGPLDLDTASPGFESLLATPNPRWARADLTLLKRTHPFAIDTDVNAAALAEGQWGAAQGL